MRYRFMLVLSLFVLAGTGCEEILGVEEGDTFTEADLVGTYLLFTNPSPNTSIGERAQWDYTFLNGRALGCNSARTYESTGYEVRGNSTIRIWFGQQYEEYELETSVGSISTGNFSGSFHLTSSVPGNVVDGTVRQSNSGRYC